ncbi:MAG: hypothetical protein P4L20_17960 [Acidimicrobiales bacterium]|nr:hypothetical protein [Acidimicrobiales bacterium]
MTSLLAGSVRAAAVAAVLGVGAAACSSNPAAAPPTQPTTTLASSATTTVPTSTAPTTAPGPVPTTTAPPAVPPAPQPSAEDAANALVGYWASGNRAAAMRVATAPAVATLFGVAYPNGLAVNRGCSSSFSPIVCTYGAPAGGPVNAPIYQLDEVQAPSGGWYVNTVQIES